jgi:hypothetical protein
MDKNNIATMNTTVLAYLGDSVYELFVRRHVLDSGQVTILCSTKGSMRSKGLSSLKSPSISRLVPWDSMKSAQFAK